MISGKKKKNADQANAFTSPLIKRHQNKLKGLNPQGNKQKAKMDKIF